MSRRKSGHPRPSDKGRDIVRNTSVVHLAGVEADVDLFSPSVVVLGLLKKRKARGREEDPLVRPSKNNAALKRDQKH